MTPRLRLLIALVALAAVTTVCVNDEPPHPDAAAPAAPELSNPITTTPTTPSPPASSRETTTTKPTPYVDVEAAQTANDNAVAHPPFQSDFERICGPLEPDKYLTEAVLELCPAFVLAGYADGDHKDRNSIVHMLYIAGAESAGDPLLNGANWGCPRQETLRPYHPNPDALLPDGRKACPYYQNRVPIAYLSHMAHLVEERSLRLLGYQINPYDPFEAALLAFALVDERGVDKGWSHWWHVHWGLNSYLERAGIRGVYYTPPPGEYWTRVRGGYQKAPWLP